ncbi:MAG TPA: hypothetical protein VFV50_16000, partial [Bdellovibrionales bacterium]|nr:hypothetical protein [Bdellovibrionales bacterium]
GANWNFVILGLYWACVVTGFVYIQPRLRVLDTKSPRLNRAITVLSVIATFHVVALGFLFFRSESLAQISGMLGSLASGAFELTTLASSSVWAYCFFVAPLLAMQIGQQRWNDLEFLVRLSPRVQYACLISALYLAFLTYLMSPASLKFSREFIYFQF